MKFRKLVSVFAAFAMLASMAVTANAEITAEKPSITLEYGEYTAIEDGGTTYYDIEITVKQSGFDGFVTYSTSGRGDSAVTNVTGIASYGHGIEMSNNAFYGYEAYTADGTKSSNAKKIGWAANGFDGYITADSTLGKYIIETTDPDAATTVSINTLSVLVAEISASKAGDEMKLALSDYGTISVDVPSYNEMNAPDEPDVTAPTVALEVADGAVANTNYFKATITKGSEAITAAGIDVTGDDVTKNYVVADVDLSDVEGGVSFYVGNVWSSAKPAFSATAYATTATGTTNSAVVTD